MKDHVINTLIHNCMTDEASLCAPFTFEVGLPHRTMEVAVGSAKDGVLYCEAIQEDRPAVLIDCAAIEYVKVIWG